MDMVSRYHMNGGCDQLKWYTQSVGIPFLLRYDPIHVMIIHYIYHIYLRSITLFAILIAFIHDNYHIYVWSIMIIHHTYCIYVWYLSCLFMIVIAFTHNLSCFFLIYHFYSQCIINVCDLLQIFVMYRQILW